MRILTNEAQYVKQKVAQTLGLCFMWRDNCRGRKCGWYEHRLKSVLLNYSGEFFEIVDKAAVFQAAAFIIRRTKNRRGMHGGHDVGSEG